MRKTGIGFRKSPNSLKNAVDLLYSTSFNYRVPSGADSIQSPKQEQENPFQLMKSDSQQVYKQVSFDPQRECSIKVIQGKNKDERGLSLNSGHSDSDLSLDSPTQDLQSAKKLQFFNPKQQSSSGNYTLVESQFGKTVKKLTNIVSQASRRLGDSKRNAYTTIDVIKDRSFDSKDSRIFKNSYVGKKQKIISPLQSITNLINPGGLINSNQATKSNFYDKNSLNQTNEGQSEIQKNDLGLNDPIRQVQEVLQNIQNEQEFDKKKKSKKKLYFGTTTTAKRKNQLQLSSRVSLENNINSSSSLNNEEEGLNSNIALQAPTNIATKDTQIGKIQQKQQALNLEGFRLQRSFSDEEKLAQQNLLTEQNIQNDKNMNDNNANNWILSKKTTMVDLFDKAFGMKNNSKEFPKNFYLESYQRLGMEEWKTSKLKIGEFLWNAKINQLKASIKKKMPAYSTVLLKQWEDYEYQPNSYASKRNISQHKEYCSPDKFKHSFKFYSPSSDLANPSKQVISTQSIYTKQIQMERFGKQNKSNNSKQILDNMASPYSTFKSNTSNERHLLSTAQTENKINNNNITTEKNDASKQEIPRKISTHKQFELKNYQQEFLQSQSKVTQRQNDLKKMIAKISDHQKVEKDQPIIPKYLIEMAKKQSQTSFFKLQDIERKKKTFKFFEKTPQYSTQEEVDDLQTLKKLKQRSNTYKTFRNHVRQYLTPQKD